MGLSPNENASKFFYTFDKLLQTFHFLNIIIILWPKASKGGDKMARSEQKRKNSSKFHKLIHKTFLFLDKVYKFLRVIYLILKLFH